jgi:hypothetical protein
MGCLLILSDVQILYNVSTGLHAITLYMPHIDITNISTISTYTKKMRIVLNMNMGPSFRKGVLIKPWRLVVLVHIRQERGGRNTCNLTLDSTATINKSRFHWAQWEDGWTLRTGAYSCRLMYSNAYIVLVIWFVRSLGEKGRGELG